MKKLLSLIFLLPMLAWGQSTEVQLSQIMTTGFDFNVMNYGAKCDGATDDTLAINSAFAAAAAAALYNPGYMQVTVSGPRDGTLHSYCVIGGPGYGVNATAFNVWNTLGNGLSAGGLRIRDLYLYCADPSHGWVACVDESDSINVTTDNLHIRGDQTNPPAVGLQEANVINGHACCIHHNFHDQVEGYFIWTARYAMGSESTNDYDSVFGNGQTTRGTIASIGFASTLAGCTSTSTFQAVPLTGGSGVNATVQVKFAANVPSTVVIDDNGYGYLTTDTPTIPFSAAAISAAGCTSGQISITINNVVSFAMVDDGQNHWWGAGGNTSHWLTPTQSTDVQISNTQLNMYGGSLRSNTAALWMMATTSHHFYHTYMNSESSTLAFPCIWLADRSNVAGAQNLNPYFDTRCEANKTGGVGDVYITGINTGPTINNIYYRVDYEKGNVTTASAVFMPDPGTAFGSGSIAFPNLDLGFFTPTKLNVFLPGKAHLFEATGRIQAQLGYQFNFPYFWSGSVCAGQFLTNNATPMGCGSYGLLDVAQLVNTQNASAYSCTRLLYQLYKGALCNIVRASDSKAMDLYPDPSGAADRSAFNSFCAGTSCSVATAYDQTGNSNCVQATAASQPAIAIDANMANAITMQFTHDGAMALPCPGVTNNTNPWGKNSSSIAAMEIVGYRGATATAAEYLAYKNNGSTLGWYLRTSASAATSPLEFVQASSTTNLDYITNNTAGNRLTNALFVVDMEYNNTSLSNAPVVNINGTAATFGTSTAPVGTIGVDTTSQSLIIGNNAATGGTNAWNGSIAEIVIWTPTAAGGLNVNQLEGVRRNPAWYYNFQSSPIVN